jgi:steroid 5-alpha reductase family enzyme
MSSRTRGFAWVSLSYLIALGAAAAVVLYSSRRFFLHPLCTTLLGTVVATVVIFVFSMIFKNVSFYDPYWSVQPMVIALYWIHLSEGVLTLKQLLILFCVSFWGVRLTVHWIRGWRGIEHEDWRYARFREEKPRQFSLIAFIGLEMMPTLLVFLGCLPLYPVLVLFPRGFGPFEGIAVAVSLGAAVIEFLSDRQMTVFQQRREVENAVMQKGLWSVSRHPNYFGEVSFWWGLSLFMFAGASSWWWTVSGACVITLLFLFVSIPLLEKRQIEKRPQYERYRKRVSMFIPWFSKSGA